MKRLAALSLLALTATACVDSEAGVRLLASRQVDAECKPVAGLQFTRGSYALPPASSGAVRGYVIAFDIESTRAAPAPTQVGGNPIGVSGQGDFLAREQVLRYEAEPALALPEQVIPFSFLLREGATEDSFITTNLLPPAVLAVLDAHFAGSAEPVSITVTLQLRGEFRSGGDVESNEVRFSLVVAAASCPAGTQLAPSAGACDINGQDGNLVCETVAVCGNGTKEGTEVCDDGNTATETQCAYGTATCTACNASCTAALSLTGPFCGDGVVNNPPEACDDGNTVDTDTCRNDCTLPPAVP